MSAVRTASRPNPQEMGAAGHVARRIPQPRPQTADQTSRRARQALLLLAGILVLVQPVGPYLRSAALDRLTAGAGIGAQWEAYQSAPAPDVLFIGPSTARLDVDTGEVGRLLGTRGGHAVRVGKLGSNAESPAFMEALLYRVLERPTRPLQIVFVVAAPMFNPIFRCQGCPRSLLALDLVQISQPYEPAFLARALSLDPEDRPLLVANWLLPLATASPFVAGAGRCMSVDAGRALLRREGGSQPAFLSAPTPCELGAHPSPSDRMEAARMPAVYAEYRDHFVRDYQFSPVQATHLRNMVAMARSSGVTVSLAQFPSYWLENVNPEADRSFQAGIRSLANDLSVPMFDFATALRGDPSLWGDPLHLNADGARVFAPMLARSVDQMWAS